MAPVRSAAVVPAPTLCLYILALALIFDFIIPPALCHITYDRQTLFNIRIQHSGCILTPFSPDPAWPREILRQWVSSNKGGRGAPRSRTRPRGKRAGVRERLRRRAHQTPLPSILLANVQSLDNKLDELRARIQFQRDIRDCNIICLTETWLTPLIPDHAVQPAELFSVHRRDRTSESGKSRGGGVCLMINNNWCDSRNVVPLKQSCSPNLELLTLKCRPHYLPREFTSVIFSAVYIPPQADTNTALSELHEVISTYQANQRDAALIVAGDFNSANLKKVIPEFIQHIDCPQALLSLF